MKTCRTCKHWRVHWVKNAPGLGGCNRAKHARWNNRTMKSHDVVTGIDFGCAMHEEGGVPLLCKHCRREAKWVVAAGIPGEAVVCDEHLPKEASSYFQVSIRTVTEEDYGNNAQEKESVD